MARIERAKESSTSWQYDKHAHALDQEPLLTDDLVKPEATPDHIQLGKPLLDALDRMGHGGVLLDGVGEVLLANATARHLLAAETSQPDGPTGDLTWMRW